MVTVEWCNMVTMKVLLNKDGNYGSGDSIQDKNNGVIIVIIIGIPTMRPGALNGRQNMVTWKIEQ